MNKEEFDKQIEALYSVRAKLDFRSHGIKIDYTQEELDALEALRDWFVKSNFDCPKCGQLLRDKVINRFTDKEKKTFLCPYCFERSNLSDLK